MRGGHVRAVLLICAVAGTLSVTSVDRIVAASARSVVGPLDATTSDSVQLERRIAQVAALLGARDSTRSGGPDSADGPPLESLFAPSFLAQVPPTQVRALIAQLRAQYGHVTAVQRTATIGADQARFRFTMRGGYAIPVTLRVGPAPEFLIAGLLFGNPTRLAPTLDAVAAELQGLHGRISALVARLDSAGRLTPLIAVNPDSALAIGSAFKLYVLGELVRAVEAGERRWDEVVRLDSTARSLPSGRLHTWPAGMPVTLQTLATLMISESDNTAADELIRVLGRNRIERAQRLLGHAAPARNVPFLTTRELFALKTPAQAALGARYAAAPTAEARRRILAEARAIPWSDLAFPVTGVPSAIDTVEWFASAADLARALRWLRDQTARGSGAPARALLSVNPGLDFPGPAWPYVGFKGGSEPGVLNFSYLLRNRRGGWYVLAVTWNDATKLVDWEVLAGLVSRTVELLDEAAA